MNHNELITLARQLGKEILEYEFQFCSCNISTIDYNTDGKTKVESFYRIIIYSNELQQNKCYKGYAAEDKDATKLPDMLRETYKKEKELLNETTG